MTVETLTFANGQVVNGHCLETNGRLFLYMYEITFADAINLLLDPANYETVQDFQYGKEKTITGYTHFYCIGEEENGMVSAGIKKD